jgi:hypothetical protein
MEEEHAPRTVKPARVPWNKGKLVGTKPPLRPSHVWSIRTKLQIEGKSALEVYSDPKLPARPTEHALPVSAGTTADAHLRPSPGQAKCKPYKATPFRAPLPAVRRCGWSHGLHRAGRDAGVSFYAL